MQYAIELFFDEEMEKKLFRYAKRIAEEKLSTKYLEWKTRPHITLACFNDVDEKVCVERLKLFAQKQQTLPAYIGSLGMFTDISIASHRMTWYGTTTAITYSDGRRSTIRSSSSVWIECISRSCRRWPIIPDRRITTSATTASESL